MRKTLQEYLSEINFSENDTEQQSLEKSINYLYKLSAARASIPTNSSDEESYREVLDNGFEPADKQLKTLFSQAITNNIDSTEFEYQVSSDFIPFLTRCFASSKEPEFIKRIYHAIKNIKASEELSDLKEKENIKNSLNEFDRLVSEKKKLGIDFNVNNEFYKSLKIEDIPEITADKIEPDFSFEHFDRKNPENILPEKKNLMKADDLNNPFQSYFTPEQIAIVEEVPKKPLEKQENKVEKEQSNEVDSKQDLSADKEPKQAQESAKSKKASNPTKNENEPAESKEIELKEKVNSESIQNGDVKSALAGATQNNLDENPFQSPMFEYLSNISSKEKTVNNKELSDSLKSYILSNPVLILREIPVLEKHLETSLKQKRKELKQTSRDFHKSDLFDDIELIERVLQKKDKIKKLASDGFVKDALESDSLKSEAILNVAKKYLNKKKISGEIADIVDSGLDKKEFKKTKKKIAKAIVEGEYGEDLQRIVKEKYKESYSKQKQKVLKQMQSQLEREKRLFDKKVKNVLNEGAVNDGTKVIMFEKDPIFAMLKNSDLGYKAIGEKSDFISSIERSGNSFSFSKNEYYAGSQKVLTEKRFGGRYIVENRVSSAEDRVKAIEFSCKQLLKKSKSIHINFSTAEKRETRVKMAKSAINLCYEAALERHFGETPMITDEMHKKALKDVNKHFKAQGFKTKDLIKEHLSEPKNKATLVSNQTHFPEEDVDLVIKELSVDQPQFSDSKLKELIDIKNGDNSTITILKRVDALKKQVNEKIEIDGKNPEVELAYKKLNNVFRTLSKATVSTISDSNTEVLFNKKTQTDKIMQVNREMKSAAKDIHKELTYVLLNKKSDIVNLIDETAKFSNQKPEEIAFKLLGDIKNGTDKKEFSGDWQETASKKLKTASKISEQFRSNIHDYYNAGFSELESITSDIRRGNSLDENYDKAKEMYEYLNKFGQMHFADKEMKERLKNEKERFDKAMEFNKRNAISKRNEQDHKRRKSNSLQMKPNQPV